MTNIKALRTRCVEALSRILDDVNPHERLLDFVLSEIERVEGRSAPVQVDQSLPKTEAQQAEGDILSNLLSGVSRNETD